MLPANLQCLKDRAKAAAQEATNIQQSDDDRRWQALLSVAQESLGELWPFVDKIRPKHLGADHTFKVCLDGHYPIYAYFCVLHSGRAFWRRQPCPGGGSPKDVERGDPDARPWWMVGRPECQVCGFFHGLGAALVYADERK